MRRILTERIFEASLDCAYKCHLLLKGRHENKSEYEEHTKLFRGMYQRAAIIRLHELNQDTETLYLNSFTSSALHNTSQLLVIKRVEANGFRSDSIVLARTNKGSFQPVSFNRYEEVTSRTKLLIAFRAILIEQVISIVPTHGRIIYGKDFTNLTIPLSTLTVKAKRMIRRINELSIQQDPEFFSLPSLRDLRISSYLPCSCN
jgi:hypothetical protein